MHTHTNLQTLSDDEYPAGVQLCDICSGGNGDQTQQEGLYFLHHLKGITVGICEGDYNNILHCNFHPQKGPFHRLLWFLCAVATLFRNNQGMSGSKLVGRLRGDSILTETEDPAKSILSITEAGRQETGRQAGSIASFTSNLKAVKKSLFIEYYISSHRQGLCQAVPSQKWLFSG